MPKMLTGDEFKQAGFKIASVILHTDFASAALTPESTAILRERLRKAMHGAEMNEKTFQAEDLRCNQYRVTAADKQGYVHALTTTLEFD